MGKVNKLLRTQQLFMPGEILVVRDGDGEVAELFWVAKLNTFEKQEVDKDAQTGRVRAMIALDANADEQLKIDELVASKTDEELVGHLAYDKQFDHLMKARHEVTADPDWKERLDVLEREGLEGATDEEIEAINQVSLDWHAEVAKRKAAIDVHFQDEMQGLPRAELEKEFRASYRRQIGANGWHEYRRRSEVLFALRDCEAVVVDGDWDHAACGYHRTPVLDSKDDLNLVADQVMVAFNEIWERLNMTEDQAGNSAAPSASSGSLELQKLAEASVPSTPTETSSSPAGS